MDLIWYSAIREQSIVSHEVFYIEVYGNHFFEINEIKKSIYFSIPSIYNLLIINQTHLKKFTF